MKDIKNDQVRIAQDFDFLEKHTNQTARLSFFKINSYKLTLLKDYLQESKKEIGKTIKMTLLNYTDASIILSDLGFFKAKLENWN